MISSETRRSPEDLTQPILPHNISWSKTMLMHTYSSLAKAQSHYQFVTICLQSNAIPWGFQINTKPPIPTPPNTTIVNKLHHEWDWIIWWASNEMLVALKRYHKGCEQHLKRDIANNMDNAIQLHVLGQSGAKDIFEKLWTVHIKNRQKLEEKHQSKLNFFY